MTRAELEPLAGGTLESSPASGRYELDPTHASLHWRVNHLNLSRYTARFTRFRVALDLQADDVERSRVLAEIELRSVRTDYIGDKDWDGELADDEQFFAAGRQPVATFSSTLVRRTAERLADVTGDLAFRGLTRPLTLSVALNGHMPDHRSGRPALGFSARGVLPRSQWGLDFGLGPMMPDEVEIIVEAELLLSQRSQENDA